MTSLAGLQDIQARKVQVYLTNHEGGDAVRVTELSDQSHSGEDKLAILPDASFRSGLIEIDIAGARYLVPKRQPDPSVSTPDLPMGAPMTS